MGLMGLEATSTGTGTDTKLQKLQKWAIKADETIIS
jgi:hypothetical protein